jgi:predicted DCC family thiol-disulfide oxidoreductase YuxK
MMAFAEKQIAEKNIRIAPVNLFKGNKRLSAISFRLFAWMDDCSFRRFSDLRYPLFGGYLIFPYPDHQWQARLMKSATGLEWHFFRKLNPFLRDGGFAHPF